MQSVEREIAERMLHAADLDFRPPPGAEVFRDLATSQQRRRRRSGLAFAAAAMAVVAVGSTVIANSLGDIPAPSAADFDPPPNPVYDQAPCPTRLPSATTSNKTLTGLDRIVAIRLCGDATAYDGTRVSTRGSGLSYPSAPDALMNGVSEFVTATRALPTPDPDRCATVSGVASRQSLVFLMDDGSTVLLGNTFCGDNLIEGNTVDGESVVQAFLAALDAQRDDESYGLRLDPLTCQTRLSNAPARPGREWLIEAVECPPGAPDKPLEASAFARLQRTWATPKAVTYELNEFSENTCTESAERPRELVASTDRGDVVRLFESPCGYLVYPDWRPGESTRIPVTFEDLGL